MNLKYTLGAIAALPLLPVMYFQGKQIRATVPSLPEATGIEGIANIGAEKTLRILCIGESTIAGVGVATHEEGFAGALGRELAKKLGGNVQWKVYARGGYTAKKVTEKIIPKVTEQTIDLIVIGLGGNDSFTLNTPGMWRRHIAELIHSIRGKFGDIPIAFTNIPPIKEFPAFTPLIKFVIGNLSEILGDELQKIVVEHNSVFFDSRKITIDDWNKRHGFDGSLKDYFSDGVHPAKLTYETWAKDFADFVARTVVIK